MADFTEQLPCGPEHQTIRISAIVISGVAGLVITAVSVLTLLLLIRHDCTLPKETRSSRVLHYVQLVYFAICGTFVLFWPGCDSLFYLLYLSHIAAYGAMMPISVVFQCHSVPFESVTAINVLYWTCATVQYLLLPSFSLNLLFQSVLLWTHYFQSVMVHFHGSNFKLYNYHWY